VAKEGIGSNVAMALFTFLLVVAVANLGVGYAVAAYLGYGPPTLRDAWEVLAGHRRAESPEGLGAGLAGPEADTLTANTLDLALLEDMDDQAAGPLEIEPYDESLQVHEDTAAADATEDWDINEKFVETSILKLNIAMIKSGLRTTDLDTRLRACRGRSDRETIHRCLEELKEDCEVYLAEQSTAAEKLHARIGEMGELASLGEEIEMANFQQGAQIETTLSNLKHMDIESDLEAANARLLEELKHLRVARHALRDSQEVAFLTVARYEGRLDKIEKRLHNDPLTGLRNRIGLETTLETWWREGRHRARPMAAALLDLDDFGRVNDAHGPMIAERILHQIAEHVQGRLGEADLAARYAGQRLFVAMLDAGPHAATKHAETIRQSIAQISFLHGEETIRLTARVAVTEVQPEDAPPAVFRRLEEALAAARQSGPNSGFFHDGRKAARVESPSFGAKPIDIAV